ncbi:MAG: hypothetical protein WBW25_08765 [Halobacteriota archaeon]|jgi:hypothetical protein
MAQIYAKRHVRLALFGCVRCGRFLFAPSWYELDRDVAVCTCDASRYKMTNLGAPRHVQEYWDAQHKAVYSSYRRRLKRHALPSVHAERSSGDTRGWRKGWREINVDEEDLSAANLDSAARTLSVFDPNSATKVASVQRQVASILHACRSALISGLSRVADVERENKGKAS